MNERVMQFRIGMFVIVAGLVLTMLIVWFGESPTLFRDYGYLTVHYEEAPGVAVGIPVRKSGIRIGEVASIQFDNRPDAGDGVLVTLALEQQYRLGAGSVPRLARALIGDVSIDILPGTSNRPIVLSTSVAQSFQANRIVEGAVTPDPSNTLATASKVLENAGATLDSIQRAATGIAKLSESSDQLDGFLGTWEATGKKLGTLADEVQVVVAENKNELAPAIRSLRQAADKVDATLDEPTRANLQKSLAQLEMGTKRLDRMLTEVEPLAADLGSPATAVKTTQAGQLIGRLDRMAFQLGLLTSALTDSSGNKLNPDGTLQRMILRADLYDNLNRTAAGIREVVDSVRPMVRNFTTFSERISRDPAALGRGVLDR